MYALGKNLKNIFGSDKQINIWIKTDATNGKNIH